MSNRQEVEWRESKQEVVWRESKLYLDTQRNIEGASKWYRKRRGQEGGRGGRERNKVGEDAIKEDN